MEYITESVRDKFFVDDKGVVCVTRFFRSGRPAWQIRVLLDDRYKDNPPTEWAQVGGEIILFNNASSQFNVEKTPATPELLSCLDEVIGDRLYIRPPKRDRWVEVPSVNGKIIKVQNRRIFSGSSHNDKIIIFETGGKITILNSV